MALGETVAPVVLDVLQPAYVLRHGFDPACRVRDALIRAGAVWLPIQIARDEAVRIAQAIDWAGRTPDELATTLILALPYLESIDGEVLSAHELAARMVAARSAQGPSRRRLVRQLRSELAATGMTPAFAGLLADWADGKFSVVADGLDGPMEVDL